MSADAKQSLKKNKALPMVMSMVLVLMMLFIDIPRSLSSGELTPLHLEVSAGGSHKEPEPPVVEVLSFCPRTGILAAACVDKKLRIFDVKTGKIIHTTGTPPRVSQLTFSPDGKTLAAAAYGEQIILWDTAPWRLFQTIRGTREPKSGLGSYEMIFLPDGKTLVSWGFGFGRVSEDTYVRAWDVKTGKMRYALPGTSTMLSPDGKYLMIKEGFVKGTLIEAQSGKVVQKLAGNVLGFSPRGTSFLIHRKGRIILAGDGAEKVLFSIPKDYQFDCEWMKLSPDGKILAAMSQSGRGDYGGQLLQLWDVETGKLLSSPIEAELADEPASGQFSPDGALFAALSNRKWPLWDARTGILRCTLEDYCTVFGFSPDSCYLMGTEIVDNSCKIYLWDTVSGKKAKILTVK